MMDAASEARLQLVHPMLSDRVKQMANLLKDEGITFLVTQGVRSWKEQARLYALGRTAPGNIVTKALPGHSYHQFGLAVDVAPLLADRSIDWNVEHPVWTKIVECGMSLGLTAGAKWRTFSDAPHFQLTGTLSASPDERVRTLLLTSGMEAVWKETGL